MTTHSCHVCMEVVDESKLVCCPNGHHCCQKHHLERIRAIYQEGRVAFGSGNGQTCFMCRQDIPDTSFSPAYFKNLLFIQAVECSTLMLGKDMKHVNNRKELNGLLEDFKVMAVASGCEHMAKALQS